ncbi:ubiquitin-like small modifier protein 1 [Streptomyces coeruleoprunus]|uniref:Ubiquitin-like small modifier protein 1 n=1 Tax=Streptomyces coeruleoprunus TaxID=285563 RepID=A0ABV9XBP4_9ACTN
MPKLYIPTIMRRHTDGRATTEVAGATVAEAFDDLATRYPGVRGLLRDNDGHLLPHINVFVNGDDIRGLDGEKTAVTDRDEVHVIPAMAGGAR